jgi:hypothetical protein
MGTKKAQSRISLFTIGGSIINNFYFFSLPVIIQREVLVNQNELFQRLRIFSVYVKILNWGIF